MLFRSDLAQDLPRVARRRVALAELRADRLQLLAEEELALVLLDAQRRAALEFADHLRARDVLLETRREPVEAGGHVAFAPYQVRWIVAADRS